MKFLYIGILGLLIACSSSGKLSESRVEVLPFFNESSFTPHWLEPNSNSLREFHKISDFELINQHGESVSSKNLKGKVYVANFFFSVCPGICPQMMENLAMVSSEFKTDSSVVILSHSVMPSKDTVPVLAAYAAKRDIQLPQWHLLTGTREEIYALGRKSYFAEEDMGIERSDDDFLHTENLVLVDTNSYVRGVYNGLNVKSVKQLIHDIKKLRLE